MTICRVFYSPLAQEGISIANYWRGKLIGFCFKLSIHVSASLAILNIDPHQVDLYEKHNTYLPALNGLVPLSGQINGSSLSTDFKANFLQLERLVMIGGPHDGVITPWQSR